MATYTVFEPALADSDPAIHAAKFAFVRDGFSWGAFIFGLIWMLWHRLWLVSVLFVLFAGALTAAVVLARFPTPAIVAVWVLLKLLLGLEASTLRRWTLQRRHWRDMGTIVGDTREEAERRFFGRWIEATAPTAHNTMPVMVAPARGYGTSYGGDGTGVIGLFPRPGGQA
jgi:hypothetical protein